MLLVQADAARLPLQDASVHVVVTSPPYWGLRSYRGLPLTVWGGDLQCAHDWSIMEVHGRRGRRGISGTGGNLTPGLGATGQGAGSGTSGMTCRICGAWQGDLGLEPLHDCFSWARDVVPCARCYVCHMRQVFREVHRVLRHDGVLWLNLGDCYATGAGEGYIPGGGVQGNRWEHETGHWPPNRRKIPGLKPKDLVGIPWHVALALQRDGWYLRSDCVWRKNNAMPSSVQDRPTTNHEYLFLLSKSERYFYDPDAIREPAGEGTKAARTVWDIPTQPSSDGAHFAKYPVALAERCILAGTSAYGCCAACQAPYRRVVDATRWLDGAIPVTGAFCSQDAPYRTPTNGIGHRRYTSKREERGFVRGCACTTDLVIPCTVLDPFFGAGTTALAARALGRRVVGCDLSWPYLAEIARERLGLRALAAWEGGSSSTPMEDYSSLPLFGCPPIMPRC